MHMGEVMLTRMSSKGQIVIPKALRELMDIKEGEVFAMFGEDDTIILKRVDLPSDEEFEILLRWGSEYARKRRIERVDWAWKVKNLVLFSQRMSGPRSKAPL